MMSSDCVLWKELVTLSRTSVVLRLVTAAMLAAGLAAAPAQAAPAEPSIAAARTLPLGSTVTVTGTSTTPSGAFESSFFDKGFAIQDRSAGIYLKLAVDLGVRPGRRVRATGVLTNSSGLLTVVPAGAAAVSVQGPGLAIRPRWRATVQVNEASEGRLVRVLARITKPVQPDRPYGDKVFVDDGSGELVVFVNTQTGIELGGLRAGQWVLVTGFSGQYDDHYEINPRSQRDITVLG